MLELGSMGLMEKKPIHWPTTLYIIGYHLFLLIALPLYFLHNLPSAALVWTTVALVFASGFGITVSYHRLWSHTTYKVTNPLLQIVFLFFGSLATQGSALQWCHDHRLHHAFVDTDKDPYSIKKGFWYAHLLWMFRKSNVVDPKIVSDLLKNKLLVFQHRYYVWCMLASNAIVALTVGWLIGDYWSAFLFAWWVRLFALHHTTWFINSLAHSWGAQHYSEEHSAVDNYFLCLFTYGEGYHNYHHTFAYDYRNGIRWYHFDPTKWIIWTLSKFGLAKDLKKTSDFRIVRQLVSEHKERLLTALKTSIHDALAPKVTEMADRVLERLSTLQQLSEAPTTLRNQLQSAKREWKAQWKEWKRLLRELRRLPLKLADEHPHGIA